EDCQTLYAHPSWDASRARTTTAAWYQRELTVPKEWTGRRILLRAEFVNSLATVYVDGQKAGEIRYPAGVADVTDLCRPGSKQVVSLHVQALPLRAVLLSYNDTNSARSVRGSVDRRGLCGDVYLVRKPASARIADVKIDTSVRKGELAVSPLLEGLRAKQSYTLRVKIRQGDQTVREF